MKHMIGKMKKNKSLMTPAHPHWYYFLGLLAGEEGCNFREVDGNHLWECNGDQSLSRAILAKHFPDVDREASLRFFSENCGECDCEIYFNVDAVAIPWTRLGE